jgi:predicted DNA-binding transcriptional regulator AlpA
MAPPADEFRTLLDPVLAKIDQLPADQLPDAIGELEAAKAKAWTRLAVPVRAEPPVPGDDGALDVREVSRRTGMSVRWLYREARADRLPFVNDRHSRRLTFDPVRLQWWLNRRRTR